MNYIHNFGYGMCVGAWCGCRCKKHVTQKIYEVGEDRIDMELDIIKIVRNLKNLRIYLKREMTDDLKMLKIIHDDQNIIYCDSADERKQKAFSKLREILEQKTATCKH